METLYKNYLTSTFMAVIALVSTYALINPRIFHQLTLHPASLFYKRQYYRFFTSVLVHNSLGHLLINLFMLYVFCSGLEEMGAKPGRMAVALIITSSWLAGNLFSFLVNRRDITFSSAGCSGIVLGCLCSYLILNPTESHLVIPFIKPVPNMYTILIYLLLILLYSLKYSKGKVDYSMHLGGAVGGALTTLVLCLT